MLRTGYRQEALLLLRFVGEASLAAAVMVALGWWWAA